MTVTDSPLFQGQISDESWSAQALGTPPATLPISVLIPAYNRGSRLRRCIYSVWAQRPWLPTEVIVVDDHSADDTAAIAASLGAKVIRHEENLGVAAARNTLLQAATCEWIAFLDSDDEWLPHHLTHLWEIRGAHSLVGASALYCASDGRGDRFSGPPTRKPMVLRSPDPLISTYNYFTTSGSMVRRNVALAVGGFHQWQVAEDVDLWIRVLETHHTAICSPRVTVLYHMHSEQLSLDTDMMNEGHCAVAEAHLERTGKSSAAVERWKGTMAWDRMKAALTRGDWRAAAQLLLSMLFEPQRLVGVAVQLWLRFRVRRRVSQLARDGGPSTAVLVRDERRRFETRKALDGQPFRDLSALSTAQVLLALARRPAGRVVVATKLHAGLVRLAGARPVAVDTLGG